MSTFTDGAPPSVTPGPGDGPDPPPDESATTGPGWLEDELKRRMAARSSGAGGRHARRDSREEPTDGARYVPRHSVAPSPAPASPTGGGPTSVPSVRRGNGWSGPEPGSARPPAGDSPETERTVVGGPSRPVPRAFRPGARGVPSDAPATFGGPGFSAPATRPAGAVGPEEPAVFGGPGFTAPATRPGLDAPHPADRDDDGPATLVGASRTGASRPVEDAASVGQAPESTRLPESRPAESRSTESGVTPPRAAARLLAAPGHVVEALGRRPVDPQQAAPPQVDPRQTDSRAPTSSRPDAVRLDGRLPDLTGPVFVPGLRVPFRPGDDEESTVLWSATAPPTEFDEDGSASIVVPEQRVPGRDPSPDLDDGPATEIVGLPTRVKVILSERRNGAHPVRTVVDIQEGGAVGELLRSNLIGSQLAVALRFAIGVGLTLGLLPVAFALFPEIGRAEFLGLRLPWLLLGVLVYPFLLVLGIWHTRTAERVEQNFADHVQD